MSTVKANSHQVGQSATAANNFTLYQPATPDGTVRLGVGNSGATTADVITASSTGVTIPSVSSNNTFGFKNRIINGGMVIDQRNAGASVTPTGNTYCLDRWFAIADASSKYSVQQVSDAPTGFSYSAKFTSLSSYSVGATQVFGLYQAIEGLNSADLNFGTSNAKTVTISFWVKSSLTGMFGGSLMNYGWTRGYPFSYTINAANTWEQKTVTIPGDTTGTWVGATNGVGMVAVFSIGSGTSRSNTAGAWTGTQYSFSATGATSIVGTNGATFYITGVQLEVGSQATSFDFRSIGQELALCQRYYEKYDSNNGSMMGVSNSSTRIVCSLFTYKTNKRAVPTITITNAAKVTTPTILDYVGVWSGAIYGSQSDAGFVPTFNYVSGASISAGLALGITGSMFYIDAEL